MVSVGPGFIEFGRSTPTLGSLSGTEVVVFGLGLTIGAANAVDIGTNTGASPMPRIRPIVTLFLTTLAAPALATESPSQSPYTQVRAAIDSMEGLQDRLNRDIERGRTGPRGKAIECLTEQRAAMQSLLDLSRIERAQLVEAMADQDHRAVAQAHRNVMLWNIKANVVADKVSGCPTQREYNVAKAVAEAEALGED